jgi:hypothetical protein
VEFQAKASLKVLYGESTFAFARSGFAIFREEAYTQVQDEVL